MCLMGNDEMTRMTAISLDAIYVCGLQIRTGVLIDDYKYKRIGDQRVWIARRRAMTRAESPIV